jgi:hypothetical protein
MLTAEPVPVFVIEPPSATTKVPAPLMVTTEPKLSALTDAFHIKVLFTGISKAKDTPMREPVTVTTLLSYRALCMASCICAIVMS